ncbi:MAG: proton-conducting transporter membrane subunit [Beijerinckiaceae bacterium]
MTGWTPMFLVATLALPLAMLVAACFAPWRKLVFAAQWLAPAPGFIAGLLCLQTGPASVRLPRLGFTLVLDTPAAMLLVVAALLWIVISVSIRDRSDDARFSFCWLLTMTGSLGVFIAGDLVSFYLLYALVSIPAYGLFAFSGDGGSRRAGAIYMAFAILGEALLLLAFAALAAGAAGASSDIASGVRTLVNAPGREIVAALLIAGFGMKLGMVPFSGWMPLNYAASPIPVAAVLSGAGVKAGVIGLIRFLPLDSAIPSIGQALVAFGFVSAFFGVALGLTQRNARSILAYSSISQMGVITAALGMAQISGAQSAAADAGFYGANHLLVKAALFLTIGALAARAKPLAGWTMALTAALALSLAGLPFTGGSLAKLATKAQFETAWVSNLALLSSIGSGWLMTHFLLQLQSTLRDASIETPRFLIAAWPALAIGAIAIPWLLFPMVGDIGKAIAPYEIWSAFWPVACGVALALGLRKGVASLPDVQPGDAIVLYEGAFRRLIAFGPKLDTLDAGLRQWPLAGVSFLLVALALVGAGLSGH